MNNRLCIVVPCYNEELVLQETTSRLEKALEGLIKQGLVDGNSFVLYVNDGSKDNTWFIISELNASHPHIAGVNLAGNVGHQNALMAGLFTAKEVANIIVTIDADLQDDTNVIEQMVNCYHNGNDIVYGVRRERNADTVFKRTTALAFYKLMAYMGVKTVYNHADYRLMSKRAVAFLCQFRERNLFIRGLVPLVGYKTDCVYYDRVERFAGESKYPLSKMLNFAIDGITSFSVRPVRMVFFLGLLFVFVSFCVLIYTLYSYFSNDVVPGWSSLMLSLWFIGGSILMAVGIVGEYIGKIYLEVKERPRYNIEKVLMTNEN